MISSLYKFPLIDIFGEDLETHSQTAAKATIIAYF